MRILDIFGEFSSQDRRIPFPRWADVSDLEQRSPNANTYAHTSAHSLGRVVMYTIPRHQESTVKTTKLIRTITVAGALAAALSLSACDMNISFGDPDQDQVESHEPDEVAANPEEAQHPEEDQPTEAQTNDPITEEDPATSSSQGTSASNGSSSSTGENAGGSDPGFEIDEDGNGVIPSSMLEDDIRDAYSKQGTTVDEVECLNDLTIVMKRGSAACNVTAYGEKRYGTVKVTSVTGSNVGYKLDFPSFD